MEDQQRERSVLLRICFKRPNIISLDCRCVESYDLLAEQSCRLIGHAGTGWVTISGDPVDHVLEWSAILQFRGPGRLVIESVGEGSLQFEIQIDAKQE